MEEKIAVDDCQVYLYYKKVLHFTAVFEVFTDSYITPDMCGKASFYFCYLCSRCKNIRKEVKQNGEVEKDTAGVEGTG